MNEFGRIGVVGVDAANLGCGEKDIVRSFRLHEGTRGCLFHQIEFGVAAQ
jgi:hypothetical protein